VVAVPASLAQGLAPQPPTARLDEIRAEVYEG